MNRTRTASPPLARLLGALVLLTLALPGAAARAQDATTRELPRRAMLGVSLQLAPDGRIAIGAIGPDTPAARAGLRSGDVLLAIDGHDASTPEVFTDAARAMRAGAQIDVAIERDATTITAQLTPVERPRETLDGARVEYDAVWIHDEIGVRTILTRPTTPPADVRARDGTLPGVMILQGIPCSTIETLANPNHPYSQLVRRFNDAGFVTLRADKPGVGDSTGPPCEDCGFDNEIDAFRAAYDQLTRTPGVDPTRLYVVGISMGVIQAPLVTDGQPVAGIVTFGGGVEPWYQYWLNNFRTRSLDAGEDPATMDARTRAWRTVLYDLFVLDHTPDRVRADHPDLCAEIEIDLDRPAGRHYTFHQELDKHDMATVWGRTNADVLAVHGQYDYIASIDDHHTIVDLVNTHTDHTAEWRVIPGMDHGFTIHDTLEDAFEHLAQGEHSEAFFDMAAQWAAEHARARLAKKNG